MGMGINEAVVQLLTSEALSFTESNVRYYDISLNTISPNVYPLQCAIVSQMAYFTGTYPLYHSCLFSNDLFKNTFIAHSDEKSYEFIETRLR